MSSHREAPNISKDPAADSTDLYAFVSPDGSGTVTIIANYVPFEAPPGGPNFYEFGDDVLYEIHVDNTGGRGPHTTYRFQFTTRIGNPDTFLYNTGPIESLESENWNRRQSYTVSRLDASGRLVELGRDLPSPPCNVGLLGIPDYPALAKAAVHDLGGGHTVFAGQRAEGFYIDSGAIFDLHSLHPVAEKHSAIKLPGLLAGPAVNPAAGINVHSIALQVPISELTRDGWSGTDVDDPRAVIGVWTTASRRSASAPAGEPKPGLEGDGYTQVSRLGNPLFNEVLVPMSRKDEWNTLTPFDDEQFARYVAHPEFAARLPELYPDQFPHLADLDAAHAPRADLLALLLTGIPAGLVPGMLRLNVAIPPSKNPDVLGVFGGDLAGYPNGRRVADNVVTIELRAIAGSTYPLVDRSYVPDAPAGELTDAAAPGEGPSGYLSEFPYLGVPHSGHEHL
jgi:hypothetical protein